MTTAFQRTAFQNDAFQIDALPPPSPSGTGGSGGSAEFEHWLIAKKYHDKAILRKAKIEAAKKRRKERRYLTALNDLVISAKNDEMNKAQIRQLISIIDPFIDAINHIESIRRSQAQFIIDEIPDMDRIDTRHITSHPIVLRKIERLYEEVKKRRFEEEEVMLVTLLMCL